MRNIYLILMISILLIASAFASDHKLKTSYPWHVALLYNDTFSVPQISSGYIVVTVYNNGPNNVAVAKYGTYSHYTGCSSVSQGNSCTVTFYPTATPEKCWIYFASGGPGPIIKGATGSTDITYYP